MHPRKERVIRGTVASEHAVQLFDDVESRAEAVASFALDGWRRHGPLLVVARPETWSLASGRLCERGCDVDESLASGNLVVMDAASTLSTFVRNGYPIPERFGATVGSLVEGLFQRSGRQVWVYGEMVDILAGQAEFVCASRLEELWNELGALVPIMLLCGYTSGHFGDPRTTPSLHEICGAHQRVSARSNDLLASWLVAHRLRAAMADHS